MAAIGKSRPVTRVSPMKPGLRGARNWATAQLRAASYSRKGFWRLCLSVGFLLFTVIFGALWLGGFLPDARQAAQNFTKDRLMAMGFVVERIDVMGEGRLRESDVRAALGVREGDYLFAMDIDAAQKRIEAISWVDQAVVRRLWPDRIVIQIIERQPYALWQNNNEIKLVDYQGQVLIDEDVTQYSHLKLIVGPEAQTQIVDIEAMMQPYPDVARRVTAFVQRPSGRWDLHLDKGQTVIQLPVEHPGKALRILSELHDNKRILDRELSVLDMRLPDRITLSPSKPERA